MPTLPVNRLGVTATTLLLVALGSPRPVVGEGVVPMPRIRTNQSNVATLIERGREHSSTFRALLETIEASDGIVYVETGRTCHGRHACLVMSVTMAGRNRILHVLVDSSASDADLIGSLGHELRHVIEVLSDPTVRSDADIYNFYLRNYPSADPRNFETTAAIQAGIDVRAELIGR